MTAFLPSWKLAKGDRKTPIAATLRQGGKPVTLETVKFYMEKEDGTVKIAETASNVTKEPTQTFTADTSTYRLTANSHRAVNGDQVVLSNVGGALPTPLAALTRYFVIEVDQNSFKLATISSGAAIVITGTGTGTHSFAIVSSVLYAWQAADVDTGGRYFAWFTNTDGSGLRDTFPPDGQKWPVDITEVI